jgi:hypothetical protein
MSVDLLRQQSRWKEGLLEIRQIIANLVQQVSWLFVAKRKQIVQIQSQPQMIIRFSSFIISVRVLKQRT